MTLILLSTRHLSVVEHGGSTAKSKAKARSKAKIVIKEEFLVHNANRGKADSKELRSIWKSVKPGKRACNRLRRNAGILYSNPASVIFG